MMHDKFSYIINIIIYCINNYGTNSTYAIGLISTTNANKVTINKITTILKDNFEKKIYKTVFLF